jgi:ubiquitin-activating enzyme E1-like protein 2
MLKEDENIVIDGSNKVTKILQNFCNNWSDCLLIGRIKFEKYFSNKAKDLLHAYPLDHEMKDGSLFWNLPKRPPTAIKFNSNNRLHLDFVQNYARLLSEIFNISRDHQLDDEVNLKNLLNDIESKVPTWVSANKHIETDENKKKDQISQDNTKTIDNLKQAGILEKFLGKNKANFNLNPLNFEKDNDQNGHIDFISVAANLRASMYSIEQSDKLHIKKIAGKIVPAIATTTSCIAGYASIELVKLIQNDWNLDKFRNLFLNLAIPLFLLSEPGACAKTKITENCFVSLWDTWSIDGNQSFTLQNLIDSIKTNYNLTVSGK